ncbi:hydroxysqualene dehydroxylase HpnE [Pelagibius marinus]|uniref:hydroxysqualene dehydroxylase HpnE n=1 Tax=Pelagibius marinus TaxID=2762760 RepID=UPI001872BF0A|nr:hydroxysqualene dehydroxylase HpnE [Pelagibius marinus]
MTETASRDRPSRGRVHVVGAGLAGLSAALRLGKLGRPVALYEAASQAGGRCRSYVDAKLERSIDNGNHMLLAANTAALDFVAEIGAGDTLTRPDRAAFPFLDLASGESWTVEPSNGPIPWWIFSAARRIPGTAAGDYLAAWKLAFAGADDTVADCLAKSGGDNGPLWERFWVPLTVAALNTHPREASARLLWLVVRESFAKGAAACHPFIARDGLSETFVDPALAAIRAQGGAVAFGRRLRALTFQADRVTALDFGEQQVPVEPGEAVVLALPPAGAADLLPGLQAPRDARPIVNAHIRLPEGATPQRRLAPDLPILGLVGGAADWLFLRGDVVSLTVSAAEDLAERPAEEVAALLWRDTARALGLDSQAEPLVRIIKEKRATLAQTPAALKLRPGPRTRWRNLALAGDWTDTGYPATIESAVRSGTAAARLLAKP